MNDIHSLSHSKWNCKYHIVFEYRRKVFYGTKRLEIGQILRQLCNWYGVTLLEAEACPDHIHMLVEIPPKHLVSSFMGVPERKEQHNDLQQVWKYEVQVSESFVLVQGLLC